MAIALLNALTTNAATGTESIIQGSVTSEANTRTKTDNPFSLSLSEEQSDDPSSMMLPDDNEMPEAPSVEATEDINEEDETIARQQWLNQQSTTTAEWQLFATQDTSAEQEVVTNTLSMLHPNTNNDDEEALSHDDGVLQPSWSDMQTTETVAYPTEPSASKPQIQTLAVTSNEEPSIQSATSQNETGKPVIESPLIQTTQSQITSNQVAPNQQTKKQHTGDEPTQLDSTKSDDYLQIQLAASHPLSNVFADSNNQTLTNDFISNNSLTSNNAFVIAVNNTDTPTVLQRKSSFNEINTADLIIASTNNVSTSNSVLTPSRLTGNSSLASDLGQTMLETLKQQVELQVTQQTRQATVRLDPPSLGQLQVTVTVTHDRLNVEIQASHDGLRQALEQTSEQLRQILATERSGQIEVQIGQHRDESSQRQTPQDASDSEVINAASSDTTELPSLPSTEPEYNWLNTTV